MRGATQGNARHHQWPVYFNPRAPCGARRAVQEQYAPNQHFNPRAPCGARPGSPTATIMLTLFQSTRPMRGATASSSARPCTARRYFNPRAPCGARHRRPLSISFLLKYFNPRAPCGARLLMMPDSYILSKFQSTRPMRGATLRAGRGYAGVSISIHAPHAGRDCLFRLPPFHGLISIHAPHAGRDP